MRSLRMIMLALILLVTPGVMFSQIILNNAGIPFIENFRRKDFKGGKQTWSITQDDRGILFFANNSGILEFDGLNWRIYPMENGSLVRKVYKSNSGQIYTGAFNEFGVLDTDPTGSLSFRSISAGLPSKLRDFGEIWSIVETDDGMLFQSFSHLFLVQDGIEALLSNRRLGYLHKVQGKVYVGDTDQGILEYHNKALSKTEWSEDLVGMIVTSILETTDHELLIGTSFNGLFLYDGNQLLKLRNQASEFLKENQLYTLIKLKDDLFAAGTIKDGIIFFNEDGEIIRHLNGETGLQNNSVLNLFLDKDQNLWTALDNGIDLIKINSPVSMLFTPDEYGTGYVSAQKDGMLYFGTNHGLFYAGKNTVLDTEKKAELMPIPETNGQVWNLQNIDKNLVCGHHNGAFEIAGSKAYQISDIPGYWKFLKLSDRSKFVIASTYTGLVLFEIDKTKTPALRFFRRLEGFQESCRELEVDDRGNIWLSHPYKGIYKIELTDDHQKIRKLDYYNEHSGLPSDYHNYIKYMDGSMLSFSVDGIYEFNYEVNQFEPNAPLTNLLGKQGVDRVCIDEYNTIWYFQDGEMGILQSNFKGVYHEEKVPFDELKNNFISGYEHVLSIEDKSLIISYEYGFLYFDKAITTKVPAEFNVLIRNISTTDGGNIYDGGIPGRLESQDSEPIALPNKKNSLKFSVSSLSYSNPDLTTYSFWLEGYEEDWSKWSGQSTKEYTKLKGGTYTLHVKAKNHYKVESREATYSFTIKKPWYFSTVAIIVYILLFLFVLWLFYSYFRKRIERDKQKIKERQLEKLKQAESEFAFEKVSSEKEIIRLRNENLTIENDRNRVQLENKSKELASIIMKISSINEVINRTKNQLDKIQLRMIHEESKQQVGRLIHFLEAEMKQADSWKQFEVYFDQVHENFISVLRKKHKDLTSKDLKMAAYLRMNLSTKEIASLFNLTNRGVETSRFRLRKKLNLSKKENLTQYLMGISDLGE